MTNDDENKMANLATDYLVEIPSEDTIGSITSMRRDLKIVHDTMDHARYYEGCTIQLGLWKTEMKMPDMGYCFISTYMDHMEMRETKDGMKADRFLRSASADSDPLVLDIDDFKGAFSFDGLFGNLVNEILPSYQEEESDSAEGHVNGVGSDALPNGNLRAPPDAGKSAQGLSSPLFPEVDALLSLFKNSCKQLVDLRKQIDGNLGDLKKEVAVQDSEHRKTLSELEKGVDGLFDSFARLDLRISSVGQTAAKIGDHLQSADAQREVASQTIELIKYLMEFNGSPGDLMELSPLFSDDSRVAEAASIAQKLRSFAEDDIGGQTMAVSSAVGNATASRGLEVAVANLQEYCNELENRLLARFDLASQKRELSTMRECAKILSQFVTNVINARTGEGLGEDICKLVRCLKPTLPSTQPGIDPRFIQHLSFNGHIRVLLGGYGDVHGGYGFGERNDEGVALFDFARAFGIVAVNSSFLKEDHLVTFRSAIAKTQIDFLLLRKGDRVLCRDCKVIPSENLST
ncbi:Exocyst complex component SEC10 [Capsicum chinense]|nr:Exocyst complex component SEC10 [Capsicum chinense]